MMENVSNAPPPANRPATEEESWDRLYGRIRMLALAKSQAMADEGGDDDDRFDRGARALRLLMSAAEIARRMKEKDQKEKEIDAESQLPAVSDDRIREIKRRLAAQIERIEAEDCALDEGSDAGGDS